MRRLRVDLKWSTVSFAEVEEQKAWDLYYEEDGIRIVLCEDIFDEGTVLAGAPIVHDLTSCGPLKTGLLSN